MLVEGLWLNRKTWAAFLLFSGASLARLYDFQVSFFANLLQRVAAGRDRKVHIYIDGKKVGDTKVQTLAAAKARLLATAQIEEIEKAALKVTKAVHVIGNDTSHRGQPFGKVAEVRIWEIALSDEEVAVNSKTLLSGDEPGMLAYYPLKEAKDHQTKEYSGNGHDGAITDASWWGCTAHIGDIENVESIPPDALVCNEYSTIIIDKATQAKSAIMRRFFAYPTVEGVMLLPDKRIEALELKWIGNGQFEPTLLGYIEGPPPVPSENLTLSDDYNGATSVELSMAEDMEFRWKRSQNVGVGAKVELFMGNEGDVLKVFKYRSGFKASLDFNYQWQNESNIIAKSSLLTSDKLELHGTP